MSFNSGASTNPFLTKSSDSGKEKQQILGNINICCSHDGIAKCFPESESEIFKKQIENVCDRYQQYIKSSHSGRISEIAEQSKPSSINPFLTDEYIEERVIKEDSNVDERMDLMSSSEERSITTSNEKPCIETSSFDSTCKCSICRFEHNKEIEMKGMVKEALSKTDASKTQSNTEASKTQSKIEASKTHSKTEAIKIPIRTEAIKTPSRTDTSRLSKYLSKSSLFKIPKMGKSNVYKTDSEIGKEGPSLSIHPTMTQSLSKNNLFRNPSEEQRFRETSKEVSEQDIKESINQLEAQHVSEIPIKESPFAIPESGVHPQSPICRELRQLTSEDKIRREIFKKKKNVLEADPKDFFVEMWSDLI